MRLSGVFFRGGFAQLDRLPPVRPAVRAAALNRVDLEWLEWDGPGPPVVLLHGLQNTAWAWARVGELLSSSSRRVIAPSQRGHGGSGMGEGGFGLDETSADLAELLDHLELDRVNLAGHSWGGKVAFHFAGNHPGRVHTLTLADPVPPAGLNRLLVSSPGLVAGAYAPERRTFKDESEWRAGVRELLYLMTQDEVDLRLWRDKFRISQDGVYHPRLPDAAFDEIMERTLATDITNLTGRIGCPVLLMKPTFNVSFFPGELRSLKEGLKRLEEARVSGDHTFVHSNSLDTARCD